MIRAALLLLSTLSLFRSTGGMSGRDASSLSLAGETVLYKDQRKTMALRALHVSRQQLLTPADEEERQLWEYDLPGLPGGSVIVRYRMDPYGVPRVENWTVYPRMSGFISQDQAMSILSHCGNIAQAVERLDMVRTDRPLSPGVLTTADPASNDKQAYLSRKCPYLRIVLYPKDGTRIGAFTCGFADDAR